MIKLLLDANLSYRLVKKLISIYPDCIHVSKTGLPIPAQDFQIYEWTKRNDYLIVTNDGDFERLIYTLGFPPKIIFLKTGNQSTAFIADLLIEKLGEVVQLQESNNIGILEIF